MQKRPNPVYAVAFILLLSCLACDKSPVVPLPVNPTVSIFVESTHTVIRGFSGDQRSETITATALDSSESPVAGVEIIFSIFDPDSFKGWLTPLGEDTLTDEEGQFQVTYTVRLSRRNVYPNDRVQIRAQSGDVTETIELNVSRIGWPETQITLDAPAVLRVPYGYFRSCNIIASILDTSGIPERGVPIRFIIDPPHKGWLNFYEGKTDINGRFITEFTNHKWQYWDVRILATAKGQTESVMIDIQPE
ncbi:Ig-like domain-containing protein [Calditrichota bacterium]